MKEKRKAILWANDFPPVVSGIATYFYNLWRVLPEDCTVIVAPKTVGYRAFDARHRMRVRRIWLPLGRSGSAKLAKTFLTIFYALGIAASGMPVKFHCGQVLSSGIAGWLCKKLFGIPYVVYVYGSETVRLGRGKVMARTMHRVLRESQWVVPNSDFTAREFQAFGVSREKLRKISPGVDPDFLRPGPKDPSLLERLELGGKYVLLTVARLDVRKGHDMVMRALRKVTEQRKADGGREEVVYLIVGRGQEEKRLRRLASELGLEDKVIFAGYVLDAELPRYYNVCDVFVMPNRITQETSLAGDLEGFGISFLEAGACGKPVVAGRSGGVEEAVRDGVTGLLVDPNSEEEIAEAILRLLEDRAWAQELGKQGRRRAETLSWQKLAEQVAEIL